MPAAVALVIAVALFIGCVAAGISELSGVLGVAAMGFFLYAVLKWIFEFLAQGE